MRTSSADATPGAGLFPHIALRNSYLMLVFCALLLLMAASCAERQVRAGQPPSTAASAKQHFAELNWKAPELSSEHPITGYNIYRSSAIREPSGKVVCKTDFKAIAKVDGHSTSYKDQTVAGGEAYCYRVTALTGHKESLPTPPIQAIIPAD